MTQKELLRKADMALSDLINDGGYMNTEQSNTFFRKMIDTPTILPEIRTVPMARPKAEINKIGFGSRILRAANQGTISTPERGETGTRALARADRTSPTFSKITMETSEMIAEINIPYETLEDNIEGDNLENTILDLMAQQVAMDLEEFILDADTGSGDDFLALDDGILKRVTSNIVNQNNAAVDPQLFADMIKSLPLKYHRLLNQYRFYVPTVKEIDYRMQVAQRQTSLGDATLTGTSPVSVLGVTMKSASKLATSKMLLTVPKNIIFGVQRQMRLEYDRDVRERTIIIVLTLRAAVQIEEEDMIVKAINVG